ncbi:MAG: cupin domain-containing protein [Ruminococcus sp.]|nr:cupin domain-containing protein [Ruminococcus sp.]
MTENAKGEFFTPPDHVNFLAKSICGKAGITDVSIAKLGKEGGGPLLNHTHPHNHLFIVTDGEAKIILGDKTIILRKNESFLVDGSIPHSVWNNREEETVMVGINISD